MLGKLSLHFWSFNLSLMFAGLGLLNQGRGTHLYGVGGAGTGRVPADPKFPAHPFFTPGREFPVQVRHATVSYADDACKDIRSGSLKLSAEPGADDSPFDLIMNTGPRNAFWNGWTFLAFVRGKMSGKAGLKAYAANNPPAGEIAQGSVRRAPETFARLYFYTKIAFRFVGDDGVLRYCKYRMVPADLGPETGIAVEPDASRPWEQDRLPDETRPEDYLRKEWPRRFKHGNKVLYKLQIQLHEPRGDDPPDLNSTARVWDSATHPWFDLLDIELDRALAHREAEALEFRVDNQPSSLGLLPATSMADYNSLAWIRSRVYPRAQRWRRWGYWLRGRPGPRDANLALETATCSGQLVHADDQEEPLHNVLVKLFDRDRLSKDDPLGMAFTDRKGDYRIEYNPRADRKGGFADLVLVVYRQRNFRDEDDVVQVIHKEIARYEGPRDAGKNSFNFGRQRVPWWEYDLTSAIPHAATLDNGDPPQKFCKGYTMNLNFQGLPVALEREKHRAIHSADPDRPKIDQIQKDYGPSMTMDPANDSRSDHFFGKRIMNGFNPTLLEKDPDNEGGFRMVHDFSLYESDGLHDLWNTDVRFVLDHEKRLMPTQITLQKRSDGGTAARSPMDEPITVTPNDGDRWNQAKRIVRCSWNIIGETDAHLAGAHLNMEQYAIAAWRHLRFNPLRDLIFPHLRSVVAINTVGGSAIFGPDGILTQNSPLTTAGARDRLVHFLGTLDWTNWKPRRPINDEHQYARAAELYWEVLTQHVDGFFADNEGEIVEHWYEVARMSRDLVRHSVVYQPDDYWDRWYDLSEIDDPNLPRETHGGLERTVRPITKVDADPPEQDIANLKQVCRYCIFHTTLFHTWANDRQVDDGGELRYSGLAMRNGSWGPESDDSIAPPPNEATQQLFFAYGLSTRTIGRVMENDQREIPKSLLDLLEAKRGEFLALGVNIDDIRSRINI